MQMQAQPKMTAWITGAIVALILIGAVWSMTSRSEPVPEVPGDILWTLPVEEQNYYQSLIDGLRSGGPPKDGIPAVDEPKFESVAQADEWLQPNDVVFGVIDGDVIAVPQRVLAWHEIVNLDLAGGTKSLTYCPLTGTAIGYHQDGDETNATLGVSGKLVNSNLVIYDRETDSYWPQIFGTAILGPETMSSFNEFPVVWTTWEKWKAAHPETQVLSHDTGFLRNYSESGDPYGSYLSESGYYFNDNLIFNPIHTDDRLSNKHVVVGVRDAERNAVAIDKDYLRTNGTVTVELAGRSVEVVYNEALDAHSASYTDTGAWINSFDAMWFAWAAYYPDTQLIQ